MIPIALDPCFVRLAVAGNGEVALRRFRALRAAGGAKVKLFSDEPSDDAVVEAGAALSRTLPDATALAGLHVLYIVGLAVDQAEALAVRARAARVLVNLEDALPFCDFHSVAEVRRGDLLLTVSTAGAAAGLSSVIRRELEARFGAEWAGHVREVRELRRRWKTEGVGVAEAARRIAALVGERSWFA